MAIQQCRMSIRKYAGYSGITILCIVTLMVTFKERAMTTARCCATDQSTIYDWLKNLTTLSRTNLILNTNRTTQGYWLSNMNDSANQRQSTSLVSLNISVGGPILVVLLTYQRTGSTFLGDIFNHNPDAFYAFEPLDSVYSQMYGTKPGWNVPDNIFNLRDGSRREIPRMEKEAVVTTVGRILTCDVASLSVEVLAHPFWTQFSPEQLRLSAYGACIVRHRVDVLNDRCQRYLQRFCPISFGNDPYGRQKQCQQFKLLNDPSILRFSNPGPGGHLRHSTFQLLLSQYSKCRETVVHTVRRCQDLFLTACESTPLRVAKTVRMTMETAELFLRTYPSAKLVHHFRDPRAVGRSRMGHDSYRAEYVRTEVEAARLYCTDLLADLKYRRRLEAEFPGRIFESLYEDQVKDPAAHAARIYRFLGAPMPTKLRSWVEAIDVANSTRIAGVWQRKMNQLSVAAIQHHCRELFETLGERWPKRL